MKRRITEREGRGTRMARARGGAGGAIVEALEVRQLLAVPVGVIEMGNAYSGGWNSWIVAHEAVVEGRTLLRPDGILTESYPMIFRDEGYLQFDRLEWGFNGYGHAAVGAQFLPEHGFRAGWWAGEFIQMDHSESTHSNLMLIVPLAMAGTPMGALGGEWRFASWTLDAYGPGDDSWSWPALGAGATGSLVIDANLGRIDWVAGAGDAPATMSMMTGWDGNSFTTDDSMMFMLSADGQTLIFAETNQGDATVMMGVATRAAHAPTVESVAGSYLGFLRGVETPIEDPELTPLPLEIRIDLSASGMYAIRSADSLWHGGESGTWSIDGSEIVLVADGGLIVRRFAVGASGGALVGGSVTENGDTRGALGFATRRVTADGVAHENVVTLPWLDESGNPIVMIDRTNEARRVADVAALSGGPMVIGDLVTWFDPVTGEAHAAGVSGLGVVVYREVTAGTWSYRVVDSGVGAEPFVTRGLSVTIAGGHQVNVFGLTEGGELVRYFTRARDATEIEWVRHNLTRRELPRNGAVTPAYRGDLVAYATSWGGLNVAGLDGRGYVWTVWWAPGSGGWRSSDITQITKSAAFTGPIDVTVTGWRGINITGVNSRGEIVTNWWAPGMGSVWTKSNLTWGTERPRLREESLAAAYRGREGAITFVGLERGTGDLIVYWWRPPPWGNEWRATDVTAYARAEEHYRMAEIIDAVVTPEGDLSVFGRTADGRAVRYWTEVRVTAEAWHVEFVDV